MDNENSGADRRAHKRLKVNFTVLYRVNKPLYLRMMIGWNKEVDAEMLDLSEGGMAILTEYDIPKSTLLTIKFTLIDLSSTVGGGIRAMNILGEVRYNLAAEGKEHRLGIYFTQIEEVDKAAVAEFVKTALSKGG